MVRLRQLCLTRYEATNHGAVTMTNAEFWLWQCQVCGFERVVLLSSNGMGSSLTHCGRRMRFVEDVSSSRANVITHLTALIIAELELMNIPLDEWIMLHREIGLGVGYAMQRRIDRLKDQQQVNLREFVSLHGYVSRPAALKKLGLDDHQFRTALQLRLVKPVQLPAELRRAFPYRTAEYYDPMKLQLTDDQREEIAVNTILSEEQAANYLGVPIQKFKSMLKHCNIGDIVVPDHKSGKLIHMYQFKDIHRLKQKR